MKTKEIVFWQSEVSPHLCGIVEALTQMGCKVLYCVFEWRSNERREIGWGTTDVSNVELRKIGSDKEITQIIRQSADDSVHIVQGVRGGGRLSRVRLALKAQGRRWGCMMETVDQRPFWWPVKMLAYKAKLSRIGGRPDFILAIGASTSKWINMLGFPSELTFPFSYFIKPAEHDRNVFRRAKLTGETFYLGFVGRLIKLKRLDLLIDAMAGIENFDVRLVVVGDGPLCGALSRHAERSLGADKLTMHGSLAIHDVASVIQDLDCLVLPSDYDGWGVVVTEALMAGVPAIVSNACGSSEAVRASGVGGIFPKGNRHALRELIVRSILSNPLDGNGKKALSEWAQIWSSNSGAEYLNKILVSVYSDALSPQPPWRCGSKNDRQMLNGE